MSTTLDPTKRCGCGCGEPVKGKSNFLPGHDARLVSQVMKGEKPVSALQAYPALEQKYHDRMDARAAKAEGKASTPKAERPAKPTAEHNAAVVRKCTVKVGRWEKPGHILRERTNVDGVEQYYVQHVANKDSKVTVAAWFPKSKVTIVID